MFTIPGTFILFFLSFLSTSVNSRICLNENRALFPCNLPFSDVAMAIDTTLNHLAFYFQDSGLPLSFSGTWSDSACRVHIPLQELQALVLMCIK